MSSLLFIAVSSVVNLVQKFLIIEWKSISISYTALLQAQYHCPMIFCTRGRKDRQEKTGEAWLFCFDNRMAITRLLYALLWNTRFTLVVPVIHVHHMAWLYKLFDDWRWGEFGGYLCCITCHVWICAKQRNGEGSFLFPLTIYHTNSAPWSTYLPKTMMYQP